ncbi:MAG: AbrB/MazE/SpoVT family DNA-binding domain-containing protein [Thermoplasmata archaeon]|nr:AbrB/MazE/SpoVT family DNA-binding domain-containing protein [Thermoplasmata archaeon]
MSELAIAKLSSKGQIVIPKNLRELLGLKSGDAFALFGKSDTIILKKLEMPSDDEFEVLLKWGSEFARKKGIKKEDVQKAVNEIRKGGN